MLALAEGGGVPVFQDDTAALLPRIPGAVRARYAGAARWELDSHPAVTTVAETVAVPVPVMT
jgi:hypothetical protein